MPSGPGGLSIVLAKEMMILSNRVKSKGEDKGMRDIQKTGSRGVDIRKTDMERTLMMMMT